MRGAWQGGRRSSCRKVCTFVMFVQPWSTLYIVNKYVYCNVRSWVYLQYIVRMPRSTLYIVRTPSYVHCKCTQVNPPPTQGRAGGQRPLRLHLRAPSSVGGSSTSRVLLTTIQGREGWGTTIHPPFNESLVSRPDDCVNLIFGVGNATGQIANHPWYQDTNVCKHPEVDDMNTHSVIVPNLSPLPPDSPRILPPCFATITISGHISKHSLRSSGAKDPRILSGRSPRPD